MSEIHEETKNHYSNATPSTDITKVSEIDEDAAIDGVDPVYAAKARVLNRAVSCLGGSAYPPDPRDRNGQIPMATVHRHRVWMVGTPDPSHVDPRAQDNLWPVVTSLILPAIVAEFRPTHGPLLTLAQNIGLLAGAIFWGFGSDLFGRKWGFNLTLGVTAVFGMISASSPNFAAIGVFDALWVSLISLLLSRLCASRLCASQLCASQPCASRLCMHKLTGRVLELGAIYQSIRPSFSNSYPEPINTYSPFYPSSGL